ncbi:UbiX family flavin prenyltransferase [Rhodopirellula sp. MGV]|uniref:UbiX family flavin prenyltransferase n=1 Tax=Rhodopirellula sp. MGV TaxID=2023130 RepID=UPI000B971510|nr:flavin prenyltransferase UbiX [Rhodopirellula sp. MGV]OYP34389.1 3-octaprenyl-4-hydroxybenzoate carboxy-lyase [Rhodopirellula sp. MGV]PNY37437.1 UbiX family flavin prenyltransferase [Rhodopirellula baltica]
MSSTRFPVVIAITGASGAIYAIRLLQSLCQSDQSVHLTISPSGAAVIAQETGLKVDLKHPDLSALISYVPDWTSDDRRAATLAVDWGTAIDQKLHYHHYEDYFTPIASGSFQTSAMVVCPCSGSTLSSIAHAASNNLISRAAEVHLKEQRKLVLVPRETPLSVLQLENMQRAAAAGATILPAMPGWYHGVDSIDSLVDFVVGRILDQLQIDNQMIHRWKDTT